MQETNNPNNVPSEDRDVFAPSDVNASYQGAIRRPDGTYAMPQRFTLRVIFAITSGSALLFGAFSALQAPVLFVLWFYGLLMFVAVAQSFLFRGIRPRASSIIAGTLYVVASCLIAIAVVIASNVPYRLSGMPCICAAVFFGPAAGYVAGLLVASLLAVVDIGERIVKRRRSPSDVDGNTD